MKKIKLILVLVLIAALMVVVLQNQEPWKVSFLWISGELPGIVLLFLTAAAGFFAGITVTLLMKHDAKTKLKKGE